MIKVPDSLRLLLNACFQLGTAGSVNSVDQNTLRRLLRYHGIRPQFLDYTTQSGYRPDFLSELSQECQHIAISHLLSLNELGLISKALKEQKVKFFAYKGSLWADWLYGNVGKREYGDIDLLIDDRDFNKALSILGSLEYLPDSYRTYLLETPERTKAFFRTDYHIPLENVKVVNSSMVEAHWEIAYPRLRFEFPSTEWEQYQTEYNVQGTKLSAFQNEYQLLLLIVHHGGKEEWCKLKYIADLAAYLIRYGDTTDWKRVEKISKEKGIFKLVMKSLGLIKAFGMPWKESWPVVTSDQDIQPYINRWMSMPDLATNSTWPYFIHGLTIRDGLKHKAKVLWGHLSYFVEFPLLATKIKWYKNNKT